VARTLLEAWDRALTDPSGSPEPVARLRAEARQAVARLRFFAGLFPGARPRALLARGWWLMLEGKRRRAARVLSSCARSAEALELPYELGHAHRLLARVTTADDRAAHARRAVDIFEAHQICTGGEATHG
jgi:hypothetical protein